MLARPVWLSGLTIHSSLHLLLLAQVAATPPMGWNSWNHYHCSVNEAILRNMRAAPGRLRASRSKLFEMARATLASSSSLLPLLKPCSNCRQLTAWHRARARRQRAIEGARQTVGVLQVDAVPHHWRRRRRLPCAATCHVRSAAPCSHCTCAAHPASQADAPCRHAHARRVREY